MSRLNKKNLCFAVLLALIVLVTWFIFGNSMLSKADSKSASIGFAAFFKRIFDPHDTIDMETFHHYIRKLAHFTEFCILGVLYQLSVINRRRKVEGITLFIPLFAVLFTAVCDEFLQSLTARGSLVSDVLLDFSGAVCGIVFTALLANLILHKKSNRKESPS